MAAQSTYLANALLGHAMGRTPYNMPSPFMALFRVSAGQSPRNASVSVGQTTIPATPNGHMYRCTASTGNTGASEPNNWPLTSGGTMTDGGVTWIEMTPDFQGNVNLTEASYTGYVRVAASGAAVWGAPSGGSISNTGTTAAGQINFTQNTGVAQTVAAAATFEASTAGNLLMFEIAAASSGVLAVSPNVAPFFGPGTFTGSLT